ncbi:MAG: hypothetical protein L0323_23845 [Planctomycetes bacterium]|nr:hypothetical protein [Planctomycetota bacterium]
MHRLPLLLLQGALPGPPQASLPRGAAAEEAGVASSQIAERARGAPLRRLPLSFVENRGQWTTDAAFVARRDGMTVRVEPEALVIRFERRSEDDGPVQGVVVRLAFEGALGSATIEGEGRQPGLHHYLLGNDPARWKVGVPGFDAVVYRGLYEGVDLRVREEGGRLEYDLILEPGTELRSVAVRCEGVEGVEVDGRGSLRLRTALGGIEQAPPRTWQATPAGDRRPVTCRYRLLGGSRYGFEAEGLDPALSLTIDPGIAFATFLGGPGNEVALDVALDGAGAMYVAGLRA